MNTSRVFTLALSMAALSLAAGLGVARAGTPQGITRVYVLTVPPPQDYAFNQGIKTWEKCLAHHGYTNKIEVYDAETGDQTRYAFLISFDSWGAMDHHSPAIRHCGGTFGNAIAPHFSDSISEMLQPAAKQSYDPDHEMASPKFVWVTEYRIKPGKMHQFKGALAKFAAAAAKTHWDGHFAASDVLGGGQGGPDFMLTWPNKSWADIGTDPTPSAMKMMQSVYGKGAKGIFKQYAHAIADEWSDVWSFDKSLTLSPAKGK